jgi:hypothetical protein
MQEVIKKHAERFLQQGWVPEPYRSNCEIDETAISNLVRNIRSSGVNGAADISNVARLGTELLRFRPILHDISAVRLAINLSFLGVLAAYTLPFYQRVRSLSTIEDFIDRIADEYDVNHHHGTIASFLDMNRLFESIDKWLGEQP